jgi:mannose-1-phosphate guanylyltransferase
MKAVVLCAGMGTRLGELTQAIPKPLLPIGDEPLLAHTLRYLGHHGYDDVAINVHRFADQLVGRFNVRFFTEETLLGTAGALTAMRDWIGDQSILVVYGDLLLDHDLRALRRDHIDRSADATLLVHRRVGGNSIVMVDDTFRITAFVERPSDEVRAAYPDPWTNSGVALLEPTLLDGLLPLQHADLPRDVYAPNVGRYRLFAHPLKGFRCAIDSLERYQRAQQAFASGEYRISR